MENYHSAKTIAIINQKGGVGKSTLTTLLANIFYFFFNKKVAIIDADYPQHTIYKRHQAAAQYISQKPTLEKVARSLYQDRAPIKIYPTTMKKADYILRKVEGKFDVVFLDIAGTLNQEGLDKSLLHINHFFIPVLQDSDTLQSSLEFFQVLKTELFSQSEAFLSCHFFLNKLPAMHQLGRYQNAILKEGGILMKTSFPHYVIYERGFRSTLLPIPNPKDCKTYRKEIIRLLQLAQEVLLICTTNKSISNPSINDVGNNLEKEEQEFAFTKSENRASVFQASAHRVEA